MQKIVDEAALNVDTVMIRDPTNNGESLSLAQPLRLAALAYLARIHHPAAFSAGLVGSIRNSGPFDAVISFTEGLTVAWNGQPLGQIAMPNVSRPVCRNIILYNASPKIPASKTATPSHWIKVNTSPNSK